MTAIGDGGPGDWKQQLGFAALDAVCKGAQAYLTRPGAGPGAFAPAAFLAMAEEGGRAAGARVARLSECGVRMTLRRGGWPLDLLVRGGERVTIFRLPNPVRFRPGAAPDDLPFLLLGRNLTRLVHGSWVRDREDGQDHFFLKAVLPAAGTSAGLIGDVAGELAAEMAWLLGELEQP